jgi:hypothetical protein
MGQNRLKTDLIANMRSRIMEHGNIWCQQAKEQSTDNFNSFRNKIVTANYSSY